MSDTVAMWIIIILFFVMSLAAAFTLIVIGIDTIKEWKNARDEWWERSGTVDEERSEE